MGGRERWSVVRGLLFDPAPRPAPCGAVASLQSISLRSVVVRKLRWGTSKVGKSEGLKVEDGGGFAQTIRNVILLPAG